MTHLERLATFYDALFTALLRSGLPRPLFTAFWWLLGGPVLVQMLVWGGYHERRQ
jgi:hypothetical protein